MIKEPYLTTQLNINHWVTEVIAFVQSFMIFEVEKFIVITRLYCYYRVAKSSCG